MRNQNVERDLKRLVAPPVPADLHARCLATLPENARHNTSQSKPLARRPLWRTQRLALAGGLLAMTAIGSAFWNTRPSNDSGKISSSSAAFAQTVQAMQNLNCFHITGKFLNTEAKGGWHSTEWSRMDGWIDLRRGAYTIRYNDPYATALLPKNFAKTTYSLMLPDGTSYERGNSRVAISKKTSSWQELKQQLVTALSGDEAATSRGATQSRRFYTGGDLQWRSTQISLWQGKQARLFIFEAETAPGSHGAPAIQKKIYVDTATNLVSATQEYAVFKGLPPRMVSQIEVDYSQPDPALFDPAKFEKGTTRISRTAPSVHP